LISSPNNLIFSRTFNNYTLTTKTDIREIIRNDELLNQVAFDVFHQYNIEQLIPVDIPGKEHKVILSKYGEVDAAHYLDPISNSILTVDHTKGVRTNYTQNLLFLPS